MGSYDGVVTCVLFSIMYLILGLQAGKDFKEQKFSKLARLFAILFWPLCLVYITVVKVIMIIIDIFED